MPRLWAYQVGRLPIQINQKSDVLLDIPLDWELTVGSLHIRPSKNPRRE